MQFLGFSCEIRSEVSRSSAEVKTKDPILWFFLLLVQVKNAHYLKYKAVVKARGIYALKRWAIAK